MTNPTGDALRALHDPRRSGSSEARDLLATILADELKVDAGEELLRHVDRLLARLWAGGFRVAPVTDGGSR